VRVSGYRYLAVWACRPKASHVPNLEDRGLEVVVAASASRPDDLGIDS
jgi:hypothetical protein